MQLRQLRYLATLARERHFGRAAEICKVSQPALSQALRHIESTFGVAIVDRRNQGFRGLTPEGQRILDWARCVLADHDQLVQELSRMTNAGLSGHIRIGVIPVAMPMVSILTTAFNRIHPGVTISVMSLNFMEIARGLENFEIDVGINYLDCGPLKLLRPYALYEETYYLLAPASHPIASRPSVTWKEAGNLPLCLLSPDMQNRRILDRIFADAGVLPRTVIETNCALALCSHVRSDHWSAIVPHTFFYLIGGWSHMRAIPLIDPVASNAVGMLIAERDPLSLTAHAFIEVAQDLAVGTELRKYIPDESKELCPS